ncbi:MAG: TIGR01212 family radical SAM protein, partial [Alistipes sp.]|nr:TIGR01212 family radical SAM protein [Alistipes sp.]
MYPWGDERRYNSYSGYFRQRFGTRLQKLSVNSGFSCPNRDGTLTTGGCTFCNNNAFSPSYCTPDKSIRQQIEEGIEFHTRRYRKAEGYLVYFQSYSNTHAPLERIREIYAQVLQIPQIRGIIIGTRPDCIDEEKLDYFATLNRTHYITIEFGIESCYDTTLQRIHRGHDFATAQQAITLTAERGIAVGGHIILGLPGESREMMAAEIDTINALPLHSVKFHQLQLFRDTPMATEYALHPEH